MTPVSRAEELYASSPRDGVSSARGGVPADTAPPWVGQCKEDLRRRRSVSREESRLPLTAVSPEEARVSRPVSPEEEDAARLLDATNVASATSTTQESINTEDSAPSKDQLPASAPAPSPAAAPEPPAPSPATPAPSPAAADRPAAPSPRRDGPPLSPHRRDLPLFTRRESGGAGTPIPEMWQTMSLQIRSAVAKSMPSTNVVKRASSAVAKEEKDAVGVDSAPTEYMIEVTDELREFTEVKMKQGALTHNKDAVSMDVLLNHVMKYNREHPTSPLNIAPALQRSFIVGKTQQYPELIAEGLRPVERIRLSSMERTYQQMLTRSIPIFKKLQKADDHYRQIPDTLMIEIKSSVAMAVSLLLGLFISFAIGWFGGPYIGIRATASRAILGLFLAVVCMLAEVGLIILRASKLDRLRAMRNRRQQRALDIARQKFQKSPTPSTEATLMADQPPGGGAGGSEELLKED